MTAGRSDSSRRSRECFNFYQFADYILGWISDYEAEAGKGLQSIGITHDYSWHRLRDFCCVLKYGSTYNELESAGDEGLIKLASLFPDCLQYDVFRNRYRRAQVERDSTFLRRFSEAQKRKLRFDRRSMAKPTFAIKSFLYLNWERPLLWPELGFGLSCLTNKQILDFLDEWIRRTHDAETYDAFAESWTTSRRVKDELRLLGLQRRSGSRYAPVRLVWREDKPVTT